jgi:hypothetical protein
MIMAVVTARFQPDCPPGSYPLMYRAVDCEVHEVYDGLDQAHPGDPSFPDPNPATVKTIDISRWA